MQSSNNEIPSQQTQWNSGTSLIPQAARSSDPLVVKNKATSDAAKAVDFTLRQIAAKGNNDRLLSYIDKHPTAHFDARSSNGNGPLHWAVLNTNLSKESIMMVAERSPFPASFQNNIGKTPISLSAERPKIQLSLRELSLRRAGLDHYQLQKPFVPPQLVR